MFIFTVCNESGSFPTLSSYKYPPYLKHKDTIYYNAAEGELLMQDKKIQEIIYNLALPIVENMGLELASVEFVKEGANWYLRLYIDREKGVDLEDCERVSRVISDLLDQKDPIAQSYFLEVSSPGIERLLQQEKDFIRFQGKYVNVHLYKPLEGRKQIKGRLGDVDSSLLRLIMEDGVVLEIPREKISQVRLAWVD